MKNDWIIRNLLSVILGAIAFGLLFNIFTGGGNAMNENMMGNGIGSYGNSINGFLASLLVLLVKFLMIVLVIAIVVGVVMWIKNNLFKDTHINISQAINHDPILKAIFGITVVVFGIVLIGWVFNNFVNPSMGYGYGMGNMDGNSMNYANGQGMMNGSGINMNGFNTTFGITGVVSLLIKVLSYVFIISLILGLVAYLKKQYEAGSFDFLKATTNQVNAGSVNTSPVASIITNPNMDQKTEQKIDQKTEIKTDQKPK
ncbi:MAG: hypothetical protein CVU84_10315 [Firmicutes bacterium HGW-Firmicutes-1]|jgi:hypothetical protein|nr:MAG: hypothetical protein CVU84_10315 [Firmicutes bacterium HGW-Firmicutes-1]